jgi:FtsH-binding integral membrane protein
MENDEIIIDREGTAGSHALAKTFMSNVFAYMFMALLISAGFAWWFGTTDLFYSLVNAETGRMTIVGWIVTLSPLGFILLMNFRFEKMSAGNILALFIAFASVMGISLSYIFRFYELAAISTTFLVTAVTFGIMAVVGYTTKTDLTKFGSILTMALIGLIIAMLVNWFVGSSTMDYIISGAGVLIFTGLTAYDTQRLKRIGMGVEYGSAMASKLAIMGATSLYLDFVNLFLFLLRFMGGRD